MKLSYQGIQDKQAFEAAGIKLPAFDWQTMAAKTEEKPYDFEEIKSQLGDMVMKDKQQKAYQSKINQLKILYPVDKM